MKLLVKDLVKIYGVEKNQIAAVDKVDLIVEEQSFSAIIGDSGSGKSTLLKLIGGLESPSGGEIWLDNVNIATLKGDKLICYRRENIGFIFQDYNLVDFLTVKENIMLPVDLIKRKPELDLFNHIIEQLGIEKFLNYNPVTLSGGEKQRVAIARALFMQPKLILADEPTGSLDSRNTEEVFNLLKDLSQKFKQTIIMVTHNIELAKRCDALIEMKDGKIYE